MCGINGIVRLSSSAPPVDVAVLRRTSEAMAKRGPDGEGIWAAEDGSCGLGHRRLAIIDLSPTGAQPMAHANGRYRMVFNGEIYNYKDLRDALLREGVAFRSASDSEVILALFEREGTAAFGKLRGMFALAIWDALERRLVLARDPYGIKPLYVARQDGWLQFASQVKALEAGRRVAGGIDPAAVAAFLLWGSVPEPRTLRPDIRALPSGCTLTVRDGTVGEPEPYRDVRALDAVPCGSIREALASTVRAHLVADVPVGVFLSAGIDSGIIAALARREAGEGLTTITMRFEDFVGTPSDEGPIAADTAKRLGTRHVERLLTAADLRGLWPEVVAAMDQPSVDGFNTYVVSRVARDAGFKVVLSGLGGDELFGGYASFHEVPALRRRVASLTGIPGASAAWEAAARTIGRSRPKLLGVPRYGGSLPGAYFVRRGLFLPEELAEILGDQMAEEGLRDANPIRAASMALERAPAEPDPWTAVHLMESTLYMRNQLLRDSDWASMAHSLELRVPFVDMRLRDEIAALDFEPARGGGKRAVAAAVAPELPDIVRSRPKTGFGIPIARALAGGDASATRGGLGSRRLALRVLDAFGVPLRSLAAAS